LSAPYQQGLDVEHYEVVLVDNGTPGGIDASLVEDFPGDLRIARLDPAPPSPARAANHGLSLATGDLVGLIVDGARMSSPRLLATACLGARLAPRPVITSPAYHLGSVKHMEAAAAGYDQRAEDELLAATGWEDDGYELFAISTFAGSSSRGWFGPMGESSALFMAPALWRELAGLDERFVLPGGGLVNHDLYRRACGLEGVTLIELIGEGTFHQFHGGAATARRFTWDEMHAEYEAIRGHRYQPPENAPLYVGTVSASAFHHLERSVQLARERRARLGSQVTF
jgi:hypothetical protein